MIRINQNPTIYHSVNRHGKLAKMKISENEKARAEALENPDPFNSVVRPELNTKKEIKSQSTKPYTVRVKPHNIPPNLRTLHQWIVWRWVRADTEWTKKPVNSKTFGPAYWQDPKTWATFAEAVSAYEDLDNNLDGIGLVLVESELVGLDFDECRFTDGSVDPEILADLDNFGTYTEVSPSGGGFRCFVFVDPQTVAKYKSKCGKVEAYNRDRWLAVTGLMVTIAPHICPDVVPRDKEFVEWADRRLGERVVRPVRDTTRVIALPEVDLDNNQTAKRLETALKDPKFARLWKGDIEGYPSMSEAVGALLLKLVFYFGDRWETGDELFRASGLHSDHWVGKWERLGQAQWADAVEFQLDRFIERTEDHWSTNDRLDDLFQVRKEPTETPKKKRRVVGYSLSELFTRPNPEWLVERHFHRKTFTVIYGAPGSYKSFLALELAMAVATGTPFLGMFSTKKMPVLYVAAEGAAGTKRRAMGWVKDRGFGEDADLRVIDCSVDLTDLDREGLEDLATVIKEDLRATPGLVIIDTLARCMDGDENTSQDMGKFISVCDAIRERTEAVILVVTHTGKEVDRGARGSSALLGAADTMIHVEREADLSIAVRCAKQKDAVEFRSYMAGGRRVEIDPTAKEESDRYNLVFDFAGNEDKTAKFRAEAAEIQRVVCRGIREQDLTTGERLLPYVKNFVDVGEKKIRHAIAEMLRFNIVTYTNRKYGLADSWQVKLSELNKEV